MKPISNGRAPEAAVSSPATPTSKMRDKSVNTGSGSHVKLFPVNDYTTEIMTRKYIARGTARARPTRACSEIRASHHCG